MFIYRLHRKPPYIQMYTSKRYEHPKSITLGSSIVCTNNQVQDYVWHTRCTCTNYCNYGFFRVRARYSKPHDWVTQMLQHRGPVALLTTSCQSSAQLLGTSTSRCWNAKCIKGNRLYYVNDADCAFRRIHNKSPSQNGVVAKFRGP